MMRRLTICAAVLLLLVFPPGTARADLEVHTHRDTVVLEDGTHVATWRAIAKRSEALKLDKEEPALTIALRLASHPEIPQPSWERVGPEIRSAQRQGLCIVTVDRTTTSEIYAAWELYTKACQGDIPPFKPDDVILFIAQRLQKWWAALLGVTTETPAASPDAKGTNGTHTNGASTAATSVAVADDKLVAALRDIVSQRLFVSFAQISGELREHLHRDVSLKEATAAGESMPELRVYLHPNNAAFLWQR